MSCMVALSGLARLGASMRPITRSPTLRMEQNVAILPCAVSKQNRSSAASRNNRKKVAALPSSDDDTITTQTLRSVEKDYDLSQKLATAFVDALVASGKFTGIILGVSMFGLAVSVLLGDDHIVSTIDENVFLLFGMIYVFFFGLKFAVP